jgi:hypothetical protein
MFLESFVPFYAHMDSFAFLCAYFSARFCSTQTKQTNSVVLGSKRSILTEQPPRVGEISANFLRIEDAALSAKRIATAVFSVF